MKIIKVLLGDFIFFEDRAEIKRIDRVLYCTEKELDEVYEEGLKHIESYLVPAEYDGKIIY